MTRSVGWLRRTAELYGELAALTEVDDPRWWLLAGGTAIAEPWAPRSGYVASDAEPGSDTFIGHRAPAPEVGELARDAVARAHAARAALRVLDGVLPDQPLAVTIRRGPLGAALEPSQLGAAAFVIGERAWWAPLADRLVDETALVADLCGALAGRAPSGPLRSVGNGPTPFATVVLGREPIATARHAHRRGWTVETIARGAWLGLAVTAELAIVSTCHLVIDGYGHAWLSARIAAELAALRPAAQALARSEHAAPPLCALPGAVPLGIAWRPLPAPAPRALPLAYAVGRLLRAEGATFSPTLQIPVAPGRRDDALRLRRRPIPAVVSVRFGRHGAEPFAAFDARARDILAREADGRGLCSRLLAAARAAPTPVAWKRRAVSAANRPRWLERISAVIGGRACVSRIHLAEDAPLLPACAVSSPARMATPSDPVGACVVTVIDDGSHAAITVCGSGLAGTAAAADRMLDDLFACL